MTAKQDGRSSLILTCLTLPNCILFIPVSYTLVYISLKTEVIEDKQEEVMNFNLLPNELLLDLFDYFNGNNLLHTFYGLNTRINFLLYKKYRCYYFKFTILSKHNFDLICQQHLPFITDRVLTLHLSDCEWTPGQINLFFSYISSIRQFTHLHSLSLSRLRSNEILMKVTIELPHLVQLTRLNFDSCYIPNYVQADFELLVNNIWNLPNLTHCHLNIRTNRSEFFVIPSVISSSLQYLSISDKRLNWSLIDQLFQFTPYLKYFHECICSFDDDNDSIRSPFSTLINLNININVNVGAHPMKIISFLQNTPNLHRLNITISSSYFIDGYQWEQLIRDYLPKLRTFRLLMMCSVIRYPITNERIDELMDSFRSSFWIDEHQWFVRCIIDERLIRFETVSKRFSYIDGKIPNVFKSTDSQDDIEKLYSNMMNISDTTFLNQPISLNICLPRIYFVSVKCPINDQYWSMIPNLHKVSSLSLYSYTDSSQSELQALFNRMSHLHTLTIYQTEPFPLPMSLFNFINPSIHHLRLEHCKHYLNEEDCIRLSHSPMMSQCKQLDVLVKNRESIIILVNNMINLRALCARFTDEKVSECVPAGMRNAVHDEIIVCKDEDIQWLIDHLPSTCFISRHPLCVNHIRIWIG